MERLVKELVSYRSVDGHLFESPEACQAHERGLPRDHFYAMSFPQRACVSSTGAFAYGFITVTNRTEYEPPAFLRTGGDVTVEDRTETVLGVALGSYDDVVKLAVENPEFWRNSSEGFIREIGFVDLRKTV